MLEADHWLFSAGDHPDIDSILDLTPKMSNPSIINFLGEFSAESLISGLQHKKIHPSVLHHINLLLDEVLSELITKASSINPKDIRATGVPAVFSSGNAHESTGIRALARECVGEAEMELRAYHQHMVQGNARGFHPSQQGRGMTAGKEAAQARFPTAEAIQMLRMRLSDLSGTSKNASDHQQHEEAALDAWENAGGDASDLTVEVAGAWLHAFLEHLTNELLTQLGRVVERDSNSAFCGPGDLFTALAEDERYWGWFARLRVKDSLEQAMKSMSKPVRHITPPTGRLTPLTGSPNHSRVSLNGRDGSFESPGRRRPNTSDSSAARGSSDTSRLASVTRKTSTMSKRFGVGHDRKDSNLSVSTKSGPDDGAKSPVEDEEEFDALVRSGETMKVSLTPSRLKTSDTRGAPQPAVPPMPSNHTPHRDTPPRASALRQPPSSGSKLAPRGATTIDERTDEEDNTVSAARPQKQSLKDLLASEPSEFDNAPPSRRAVPAVILGAPPPGAGLGPAMPSPATTVPERGAGHVASPSQASMSSDLFTPGAPSLNRDAPSTGRDTLASRRAGNTSGSAQSKARSEAQELADFFNSTPPPPPPPAAPASRPATSTKSGKGFRGFVSKVTGGSKKREEDARIARENAAFDAVNVPADPRKQRSMASFATTNTANTAHAAPPSAFRGDDAPPLPQKLRKRSDASGVTDKADGHSEGIMVHRTSSSTARPSPPDSTSSSERVLGTTSTVETGRYNNGLAPGPPRPPRPADDDSQETLGPIRATASSHLASPYQGRSAHQPSYEQKQDSRPVEAAAKTKQAAQMIHLEPAVATVTPPNARPVHADRSPSDANSFATAEEGTDGEVDMPVATPGPADQAETSTLSGRDGDEPIASTSAAPEPVEIEPPAPSILVSRLKPLRTILQHATSADECRMLLNAYCAQIGIPLDVGAAGPEVTAEAKVHAWLLDHESGPPVSWPWSPPVSRVEDSPELQVPMHPYWDHAQMQGGFIPQVQPSASFNMFQYMYGDKTVQDQGKSAMPQQLEEVERRKEDEEVASVESLSEEDARGGPSFATAATRTSPVRVAPTASAA